ncbi:MAG TPA: HAD-IA family hydrolase [Anaerolineae bacterium]|jgi:pyrophosphatase PpaX|nr:HAD-IA family hydrolase [Anaerolineae bacterium]
MRNFKAILFDIDGTLLDTSELIFQAFEYTLGTYGFPLKSREEIASLVGKPLSFCYKTLTSVSEVQEFCDVHRAFQVNHLHLSKPYPNARDTLESLKSAGVKIAAVTTRAKSTVLETLDLAKLSGYIGYTIALEDVENLKPHPEPLLKALGYLQVEPKDAVMVGDTDVDILAGKNAGTTTIGVTYGFHGQRIIESNPDYTIDDIAEIVPLVLSLPGK